MIDTPLNKRMHRTVQREGVSRFRSRKRCAALSAAGVGVDTASNFALHSADAQARRR